MITISDGRLQITADSIGALGLEFDRLAEPIDRLAPIAGLLERLKRGGKYAAIAHDRHDDKIVFINHDGTRFARTPAQLAKLFGITPRPAPAPLRLTR